MLPTVRSVSAKEIADVVRFMKQFESVSKFVTVDQDHATKTYEQLVLDGLATVLVLEQAGEMIGSFGFLHAPDLHSGEMMLIETFWLVDKEHRGHGLLLFNEFERYAKKLGVKKIAMIHMEDSYPEQLKKLYQKRGYILMEQHYVKRTG